MTFKITAEEKKLILRRRKKTSGQIVDKEFADDVAEFIKKAISSLEDAKEHLDNIDSDLLEEALEGTALKLFSKPMAMSVKHLKNAISTAYSARKALDKYLD